MLKQLDRSGLFEPLRKFCDKEIYDGQIRLGKRWGKVMLKKVHRCGLFEPLKILEKKDKIYGNFIRGKKGTKVYQQCN